MCNGRNEKVAFITACNNDISSVNDKENNVFRKIIKKYLF